MTPEFPAGAAAGPAPHFPEAVFSDRAGDVLGVRDEASGAAEVSPMSRALMSLDGAAGWAEKDEESPGENRRREILQSAAELFAERGYRGTSLRDISGRVGISHPGMLHHFKSKEALLDAVIDSLEAHAQNLIDNMQSLVGTHEDVSAAVKRDFANDFRRHLLFAQLTTEAVSADFPCRIRIIRLRRVYEHIAEHVLKEYAKRDLLKPGIDLAQASRTTVSLAIALATREATIGDVQPSAAGVAAGDFLAYIHDLRA